jgi:hypothetical protein
MSSSVTVLFNNVIEPLHVSANDSHRWMVTNIPKEMLQTKKQNKLHGP